MGIHLAQRVLPLGLTVLHQQRVGGLEVLLADALGLLSVFSWMCTFESLSPSALFGFGNGVGQGNDRIVQAVEVEVEAQASWPSLLADKQPATALALF